MIKILNPVTIVNVIIKQARCVVIKRRKVFFSITYAFWRSYPVTNRRVRLKMARLLYFSIYWIIGYRQFSFSSPRQILVQKIGQVPGRKIKCVKLTLSRTFRVKIESFYQRTTDHPLNFLLTWLTRIRWKLALFRIIQRSFPIAFMLL